MKERFLPMKKWKETRDVFERLREEIQGGRHCVLATITHIDGSTYRRPGAKLLVTQDRSYSGNISGGCLEQDVLQHAISLLNAPTCRSITYDTEKEGDVWGLGLGCNGLIQLFLRPFSMQDAEQIEQVLALMSRREAFTLLTVIEGEETGRMHVRRDVCTGSDAEWADVFEPPPKVLLCGGGDDSHALARLATELGFHVTVADHRKASLDPTRYPNGTVLRNIQPDQGEDLLDDETFVVIKMHALRWDTEWLNVASGSTAPYVGLLGPRARCADLCRRAAVSSRDRVYGPAGLDIGAEGAEQIAFSIMAEIMAIWGRRTVGHLRDRAQAIHHV